MSGYAIRSDMIVRAQRDLGAETCVLTSTNQGRSEAPVEERYGIRHYRTPEFAGNRLPHRRRGDVERGRNADIALAPTQGTQQLSDPE
jgi:hypothetical protein